MVILTSNGDTIIMKVFCLWKGLSIPLQMSWLLNLSKTRKFSFLISRTRVRYLHFTLGKKLHISIVHICRQWAQRHTNHLRKVLIHFYLHLDDWSIKHKEVLQTIRIKIINQSSSCMVRSVWCLSFQNNIEFNSVDKREFWNPGWNNLEYFYHFI